jgi:ribonuclease HI
MVRIRYKSSKVPIKYLGYTINAFEGKITVTNTWVLHNHSWYQKLLRAIDRFENSRFHRKEALKIINSDIISIMGFFTHISFIPKNVRGEGGVSMKNIKSAILRAARKKLGLPINTPMASIFSQVKGRGFGIMNPEAVYGTTKIDNALLCIQSPSETCRVSTLDSIDEINALRGCNILNPKKSRKAPTQFDHMQFPMWLVELHEALLTVNRVIEINPLEAPMISQEHPMKFWDTKWRKGEINELDRTDFVKVLKKAGVGSMCDFFPTWGLQGEDNGYLKRLKERSVHDRHSDGNRGAYTILRDDLRREGVWEKLQISNASTWKQYSFLFASATAKAICNHHPHMELRSNKTRQNYDPFVSPCVERVRDKLRRDLSEVRVIRLATDGSYTKTDNLAGIGYAFEECLDSFDMALRIPGKQSIDRAEAFALLNSLDVAPFDKDIHAIMDSQSTIDGVNRILKNSYEPKLYKTLANFSILKAIALNISERKERGFEVLLVKVKSHTGLLDANSLLNVRADVAADQGRHISQVNFTECFQNLPYGYLSNEKNEIVETKPHTTIMRELDGILLEKAIQDAGEGQHLKNLELKDVWVESISDVKHEEFFLFSSKLRVQSLPTPRNIQVLAKPFPLLYPESLCPCKEGVGDEFHIMCECKFLKEKRVALVKQAHTRFNEWIKPQSKGAVLPIDLIKFIYFPQNKCDFKNGFIHKRLGDWAKEVGFNEEECEMWSSKLERDLLGAYHFLWDLYTRHMERNKLCLKDRLKAEYSLKTSEMTSKRQQVGPSGIVTPNPTMPNL